MAFVFRDLFPDERSYRPGEVAQRLGVHVDTVRGWITKSQVEYFCLGGHRRIPYESLEKLTTAKLTTPHRNLSNLKK